MKMPLEFREAQLPPNAAIPPMRDSSLALLVKLGIELPPVIKAWECLCDSKVVGHCAGNARTGEVAILSVLPDFEGQGIGRRLLTLVVDWLRAEGATRIWLAATSDPSHRAYGFYRALGWQPSGSHLAHGDEILELPITHARGRTPQGPAHPTDPTETHRDLY
jgi:GNAT superfamily N-acetyltransferase